MPGGDECPICLSSLADTDDSIMVLPCGCDGAKPHACTRRARSGGSSRRRAAPSAGATSADTWRQHRRQLFCPSAPSGHGKARALVSPRALAANGGGAGLTPREPTSPRDRTASRPSPRLTARSLGASSPRSARGLTPAPPEAAPPPLLPRAILPHELAAKLRPDRAVGINGKLWIRPMSAGRPVIV